MSKILVEIQNGPNVRGIVLGSTRVKATVLNAVPVILPSSAKKEIIPLDDSDEIEIEWTTARKQKFGLFPAIAVYKEGDKIDVPISYDAPPPDTSLITVYNPGSPGFIVIS